MDITVKEIAKLIDGEVIGNPDILIFGISGIKEAKEGDITFLANPKYSSFLETTKASCIIVDRDTSSKTKTLIRVDNPSVAFSKIINILNKIDIYYPKGIHPTAIISDKAKLEKNVSIGAYSVVEDGVCIGENTIIYPNCYIGHSVKIGKDCLIYPSVVIRENVIIKDRVIIHSGTIIGSDGFGYVLVDGVNQKIPQVGTVLIEDDVEIGANVTIDRARFDKTIIGEGTKIDNLVQIAHNVKIGKNCIIISQVGISGSTTLGDNVILAGQVGLVGHINIGDNSIVMAQSGVTKDLPKNSKVFGSPAKDHSEAKRIIALIDKLPIIYKRLKELEKEIEELKKSKNE